MQVIGSRLGRTAVVVVLLLVVAACTPLDGRSVSVEVGELRPEGVARVEVPWWVTTTTVDRANPSATPDASTATGGADLGAPGAVAPAQVPTDPAAPGAATATATVGRADQAAVTAAAPEDVVSAALALVRYDWSARLPGWELRFLDGRRGIRGFTYFDRRLIEIFVRPGDSPERLAHVVAHELGHAVDLTLLSPLERDLWRQGRGLGPGTVWYPGRDGQPDFATGAGDFAEAFAWLHGPGGQWSGELGPPPSAAQALLMAILIDPST